MYFKHLLLKKIEIERVDTENGRFYILPDGSKVPSVTTVLYKNEPQIDSEIYRRRGTQARHRGEIVHQMMEKYLLNDPVKNSMPVDKLSFKPVKEVLDKNISCVLGVEHRLYSTELQAAGTCDILAIWKGDKNSATIIDLKTLRRKRSDKIIYKYLLQSTAYSMMVEEVFNIPVSRIIIICSIDHENEPDVHNYSSYNLRNKVREIFKDQ